jgi:hypothetical protein
MSRRFLLAVVLCFLPIVARAQSAALDVSGTWEAETPDGPQTIVVRPDSTASFGEETVRWRIVADTIYIEFGDEWMGYNYELEGDLLTLSGGDLLDPVTLKRVGPPSMSCAASRDELRGRPRS